SHVVPALMAKAHRARIERSPVMTVWGTGTPLRELLYVDDAADGLVFLMQHHSGEDFVNLGTGVEISIAELAATICRVVGFAGRLEFDRTKPDGTPRKVMDVSRLHSMGWTAPTGFEEGLERTYRWYVDNLGSQARAAG
ncbi:MAG: NAD-dependent epimerase/dehydratase family protein, partial [Ferrovibrionaceae bacterium]